MRKKPLIISLSIILCVAAATTIGVLAYSSFFNAPSEDKTAQPDELLLQYFSGIEGGQYEELYDMLSEQSQVTILKENFISRNENIYGGIEAANISVSVTGVLDPEEKPEYLLITDEANSDAVLKVVEYSLRMDTAAGEVSHTNYAVFILNEEKEYRLEWTDRLIFPSLTSEDKVRVNTLSAARGNIYDRNGEMLAGEGVASSIGFVPGKMQGGSPQTTSSLTPETESPAAPAETTDAAAREADIARVAELLGMSVEDINKKLSASYVKDDTFVPLKTVSKDQQELKDALLEIPGIMITDQSVRYYPLGEKASHLVGYIQNINAEELEVLREQGYHMNSVLGKAGIEKLYEEQLRAVDGCEIRIMDKDGNLKETVAKVDKIDGESITLTIDAQAQSQLYDQCAQDKSCSVAMNPKTGEVLALVSTPTYNANDFVLGMSMNQWTALNEDENKPMYNRFKAALCPGSTFKAVTAAIGIDTGIISPTDDFGHSGLKWRKDESWGGYWITTTMEYSGPANIENALKFSDNIYFAKAALQIGSDVFVEQLKSLGFEDRIPFEFGLYSSIISSTKTFTSEIQLADSGFGQGEILTNPIHLASIYSAFVNDGSMIQPYLILSDETSPTFWIENAFTPETAVIVRDSLIQVIESGSATDAKISGMTLAGKTGTAEIKQSKDDADGTELGWFVMFTADDNAENPLLVITMIEDVKGRGGSHYVVPKVKTLFE